MLVERLAARGAALPASPDRAATYQLILLVIAILTLALQVTTTVHEWSDGPSTVIVKTPQPAPPAEPPPAAPSPNIENV
jgi:hypothetical protein